jgi:hypothetical protein
MLFEPRTIGDEMVEQVLSRDELLDQFVFAREIGVVDRNAVQAAVEEISAHRTFLRQ